RRHFDRLVEESGSRITWHFVLNPDHYPHPEAPFSYPDPAEVLPLRYGAMKEHGGIQGGYLGTLLIPVLSGLDPDHLWVCEYDVDYAGAWHELFDRVSSSEADLLTSTLLYRRHHRKWRCWRRAAAPEDVPRRRWVRSFNPLMRVSRSLLD